MGVDDALDVRTLAIDFRMNGELQWRVTPPLACSIEVNGDDIVWPDLFESQGWGHPHVRCALDTRTDVSVDGVHLPCHSENITRSCHFCPYVHGMSPFSLHQRAREMPVPDSTGAALYLKCSQCVTSRTYSPCINAGGLRGLVLARQGGCQGHAVFRQQLCEAATMLATGRTPRGVRRCWRRVRRTRLPW